VYCFVLLNDVWQPSGSSDPAFSHAQSLRCMCTRLLKRFKHLPSAAPDQEQEQDQEQQQQRQQQQQQLAFRIKLPDNVLNLIWSLSSLCAAADVPFADSDARVFLHDLLRCCPTPSFHSDFVYQMTQIMQLHLSRERQVRTARARVRA
jgi:hypothetical protein